MATIPTIRSPLEFSKPQLKKLCLQASRGHPRAYEVLSQIDDELSEYNSQMSALDTQIVLLTFQRNQHNKYTTVSPGIETGIASEISALQIHIEILSSHRGVSYEHKRIISSFLSPLNRLLPNEILIKILVLACDEHDVARDLAPLGLASICHRWREVVLTSTELWSSFKITVSTTYQVPMRFNDPMRRDALLEIERLEMRLEKRINVYLERSGGHLLNLHVIDDNLKTPDTKIRLSYGAVNAGDV
ncbi:hypothetical protein BDP27DRAFT_1365751 [Rhodocollybia butyracea]|uniref:F-box domain-containing protein n=1 Tax=Rhodocollybia butyracea TaxID=206335 RepID=A0A9P5PN51_9AGAR|nr:hypothetical protein BDP27DRAFT_1365751 [Rhodocollybia butyracea]